MAPTRHLWSDFDTALQPSAVNIDRILKRCLFKTRGLFLTDAMWEDNIGLHELLIAPKVGRLAKVRSPEENANALRQLLIDRTYGPPPLRVFARPQASTDITQLRHIWFAKDRNQVALSVSLRAKGVWGDFKKLHMDPNVSQEQLIARYRDLMGIKQLDYATEVYCELAKEGCVFSGSVTKPYQSYVEAYLKEYEENKFEGLKCYKDIVLAVKRRLEQQGFVDRSDLYRFIISSWCEKNGYDPVATAELQQKDMPTKLRRVLMYLADTPHYEQYCQGISDYQDTENVRKGNSQQSAAIYNSPGSKRWLTLNLRKEHEYETGDIPSYVLHNLGWDFFINHPIRASNEFRRYIEHVVECHPSQRNEEAERRYFQYLEEEVRYYFGETGKLREMEKIPWRQRVTVWRLIGVSLVPGALAGGTVYFSMQSGLPPEATAFLSGFVTSAALIVSVPVAGLYRPQSQLRIFLDSLKMT